ncbi:hypothetical protein PACTADRAFT_75886 [Pachysolen tannophilus NRRL Y-2460]|uniref:AAA+ ATPase domain-containing protein n=1 Tax=Pachysolen tannophilus NRRL Y-2460 TaxID=669874 RepID=A0A1E4TUE5_PACTA|nr:hypothetical protein PACTADRAFT_75886 [Pachysolen tannophilus NRRL Y-2460]
MTIKSIPLEIRNGFKTRIISKNNFPLLNFNKNVLQFQVRSFHSTSLKNQEEFDKNNKNSINQEAGEIYKEISKIWENQSLDVKQKSDAINELFEKHKIGTLDDPVIVQLSKLILEDQDVNMDTRFLNIQKLHSSILLYHTKRKYEQKEELNNQTSSSEIKDEKKNDKEIKFTVLEIRPDLAILYLLSFALLLYVITSTSSPQTEITWQEFRTSLLDKGFVEKLVVANKSTVYVILNENGKQNALNNNVEYYFTIGSIDKFEHNMLKAQEENGVQEEFRVPIIYTTQGSLLKGLFAFLPTILMLYGLYWITKKAAKSANGIGGGIFGAGKSKAKKFNLEKDVKVKFEDVAGCDEAKEEIMEFVKFLKNPKKYEKLGAKIPRGAILSGPPGTGKTLLAKATAGEAGVPFYSVSGSEFVEMFVGVGASRVRDLFKTAREDAPSIVFIDEIDAIGKSRSKNSMTGGNDERENTLNQLLVEMDGFSTSDHVVVLAGTNRPDVLDSALLRPGRFDRKVLIDNPELEGRKRIFEVHLKKIKISPEEDLEDLKGRLATLTPGFSGADIANCCNESALIAARLDEEYVKLKHFEMAIERVIAGLEKKTRVLSPEEKRIVAYHEAGHAICGWYLKNADPLLKVSIVPRGSAALGYAQYLPPDIYLYSVERLMDRMTMTLAGRVSEELHFESVTSGGHDDFEKVTAIAQKMVIECGMSPKIGFINFNQDRGNDMTKPYSDQTAELIDEEIHRIVQECYVRCKQLLSEKSEELGLVAELLLEKEVITREDMIRLLGKRPFPSQSDAFDKYLAGKEEKSNGDLALGFNKFEDEKK